MAWGTTRRAILQFGVICGPVDGGTAYPLASELLPVRAPRAALAPSSTLVQSQLAAGPTSPATATSSGIARREAAAIKMQAMYRGHHARRKVRGMRGGLVGSMMGLAVRFTTQPAEID